MLSHHEFLMMDEKVVAGLLCTDPVAKVDTSFKAAAIQLDDGTDQADVASRRAAYEATRQHLLSVAKEKINMLLAQAADDPLFVRVAESEPLVAGVIDVLVHIFCHAIKNRARTKSGSVSFWPVVQRLKDLLPSAIYGIAIVENLPKTVTIRGKQRAWIQRSVADRSMELSLAAITQDADLLALWYEPEAFLRDHMCVNSLEMLLSGLIGIGIHFDSSQSFDPPDVVEEPESPDSKTSTPVHHYAAAAAGRGSSVVRQRSGSELKKKKKQIAVIADATSHLPFMNPMGPNPLIVAPAIPDDPTRMFSSAPVSIGRRKSKDTLQMTDTPTEKIRRKKKSIVIGGDKDSKAHSLDEREENRAVIITTNSTETQSEGGGRRERFLGEEEEETEDLTVATPSSFVTESSLGDGGSLSARLLSPAAAATGIASLTIGEKDFPEVLQALPAAKEDGNELKITVEKNIAPGQTTPPSSRPSSVVGHSPESLLLKESLDTPGSEEKKKRTEQEEEKAVVAEPLPAVAVVANNNGLNAKEEKQQQSQVSRVETQSLQQQKQQLDHHIREYHQSHSQPEDRDLHRHHHHHSHHEHRNSRHSTDSHNNDDEEDEEKRSHSHSGEWNAAHAAWWMAQDDRVGVASNSGNNNNNNAFTALHNNDNNNNSYNHNEGGWGNGNNNNNKWKSEYDDWHSSASSSSRDRANSLDGGGGGGGSAARGAIFDAFYHSSSTLSDSTSSYQNLNQRYGIVTDEIDASDGPRPKNVPRHCEQCMTKFDRWSLRPRYCHYFRMYFCPNCHVNDKFVIPGKIVNEMDTKEYTVCRKAFEQLKSVVAKPLLCVDAIDPTLRKKNLIEIQNLRLKLSLMRGYMGSCVKFRQKYESDGPLFDPDSYYAASPELFSVQDFVDTANNSLLSRMQSAVDLIEKHIVSECELCQQKGFVCELCNSLTPIFPFELESTVQCTECKTYFHSRCWEREERENPCPKCERIERAQGKRARDAIVIINENYV